MLISVHQQLGKILGWADHEDTSECGVAEQRAPQGLSPWTQGGKYHRPSATLT